MIINAINMKQPPLGRLMYCREALYHLAYITNVQVVKFYLFFFFFLICHSVLYFKKFAIGTTNLLRKM